MTSSNKNNHSWLQAIKHQFQHFFVDWKWFDYVFLVTSLVIIICISILFANDDFVMILCSCLGILTTFLSAKGKLLCYLFGMVQTVMYAMICFYHADYINFAIYLVCFSIVEFYGIYHWKQNYDTTSVRPRTLSWKQRLFVFSLIALMIIVITVILCGINNNFQSTSILNHFFDASSGIFALSAISLMALRFQEQWIIWIIGDLCQIGLWTYHYLNGNNGLSLLIMTIILTLISIYGLINWYLKLKSMNKKPV